jgi:hypothetical protein
MLSPAPEPTGTWHLDVVGVAERGSGAARALSAPAAPALAAAAAPKLPLETEPARQNASASALARLAATQLAARSCHHRVSIMDRARVPPSIYLLTALTRRCWRRQHKQTPI